MLITPDNFSISPSAQEGQVYGTEFVFTSLLPLEYNSFVWDFGDGNKTYNKSIATHTYGYPGLYTVRLSAWTDYGKLYTEYATVNADYVYRDAVVFSKLPETYNLPGAINPDSFTVSVTSAKINQPLAVYLQSYGSISLPQYAVPTKWRFIVPTWKFLDADQNLLPDNLLQIPTVPIYNDENKIVAVKGEASFYYVDDVSTSADFTKTCPLLLGASLSTQHFSYPLESLIYPYASYANNETVKAIQDWQISENLPTQLKVTENYINEVYPLKWANVPIPLMITLESDPLASSPEFLEGEVRTTKCLTYPKSNELGAINPIVISLSSNGVLPGIALTNGVHFSANSDTYFKATDEQGNFAAGYALATITPLAAALTAVVPDSSFVVTASTVAVNSTAQVVGFSYPYNYPIRANTYVSHPYGNSINKLAVFKYPAYCQVVDYYKDLNLLAEGSTFTYFNVPGLTSADVFQETLSGASSVYGMAFNPIKNRLYACDVDSNMLRMYDSNNIEMSAVNLASLFGTEKLAPSHVSIDRLHNVWISLYDDYRLVKFDFNLNYLLSAAPTFFRNTAASISLAPPVVETDRKNQVWACWFNETSAVLCHFDSKGREISDDREFLPLRSEPVSIAVDPKNNVWLACKGTNSIVKFDSSTGQETSKTLSKSVTGAFLRPSYLALDRDARVWVAHGYNLCSVYDTFTEQVSTWRFTTYKDVSSNTFQMSSVYIPELEEIDYQIYYKDEIWGGLATDVYDRVWVINSVDNVYATFSVNDPTDIITATAVPSVTGMPVILGNDTFVSVVSTTRVRSAQAGGDWTGNRWYQKYTAIAQQSTVYGISEPFKLYDINESFRVAKVNETFDFASYFKSLALPEVLSKNSTFFDEFMAAVGGDANPSKESAGRIIYERIANYVQTHADLDTAEIDQLKSFAEQVNVEVKTFGKDFPVAINRLLNLFSIPKQQLRGIPKLTTDLSKGIRNFVSNTDLITADRFYYLQDKTYGDVYVVQAMGETENQTFPLSSWDVAGLRGQLATGSPLWTNYYVYEYSKDAYDGYIGNVIDWESPYTSVSYNLSSNEDWYGDGGLVETMFNNLLTKQLYGQ